MSIENRETDFNEPQREQEEAPKLRLREFLMELEREGVNPLPEEMIRKQLNDTGIAIVTRDYGCGIRISRTGSRYSSCKYKIWTTNDLEDPNHPLSKKFAGKSITID